MGQCIPIWSAKSIFIVTVYPFLPLKVKVKVNLVYGILIVLCKTNMLAEIISRPNFVLMLLNELHGGVQYHQYYLQGHAIA
jgi:hypothetical protein